MRSHHQRPAFERWSEIHAGLMLAACAVSLAIARTWPLAVIAAVSFAVLIRAGTGAFTPRGDFGAPNLITALRLLVTGAIGFGWGELPSFTLAAVVLGLWVLDGVDGWLARRTGHSSEFGARFDMEADAFMVLMVELVLWQRGGFGAWILLTGVLRYAYMLSLAVVPSRRGEVPRSSMGRYAFGCLVLGLIGAIAVPHAIATWTAAIGTALVSASFARSFHWSYRAPSVRASGASLPDVAPGR
jgi:phosphatidylglycerophosphate synthase